MSLKPSLLILLVSPIAISLYAQESSVVPKAAEATVYIYRLDYEPFLYSFIFSRRLSIKFAGAVGAPKDLPQIASLRNKRYLILKLAPGSYLFDTRMMVDKLRIDLAPGDERYLRWDHGEECPTRDPDYPSECEDRAAGIYEMPADVGRRELARVKPISKSDVKNRTLVIIPPK